MNIGTFLVRERILRWTVEYLIDTTHLHRVLEAKRLESLR